MLLMHDRSEHVTLEIFTLLGENHITIGTHAPDTTNIFRP
jgi:hypothetical protein